MISRKNSGNGLRRNETAKRESTKTSGGEMNIKHELTATQRKALEMRFIQNCTIFEIAQKLSISWDEADRMIESTLTELRLSAAMKTA